MILAMTNEEFIKSISLEGEIWKDVIGYEETYMVSSYGRVVFKERFRDNGNGGYVMPPKLCHLMETKFGYLQARLYKDNKEKKCYVHRLVASAHISNPNNYPIIDHIDTNRKNNKVSNLRWCNSSMNALNPITRKRNSLSKIGNRKIILANSKSVVRINPSNPNDIKIYESPTFAKKTEGYNQGHISAVCLGKRKYHKGYKWMYLSDYEAQFNKSKNS